MCVCSSGGTFSDVQVAPASVHEHYMFEWKEHDCLPHTILYKRYGCVRRRM